MLEKVNILVDSASKPVKLKMKFDFLHVAHFHHMNLVFFLIVEAVFYQLHFFMELIIINFKHEVFFSWLLMIFNYLFHQTILEREKD